MRVNIRIITNDFDSGARRIAAILLMEPELDANYEAVKKSTYPWKSSS